MSTYRAVRLALALALVGSAPLANAAELVANGPAECADSVELSFRIERSIGMPLAQAAPLAFDVVMERTAAGYVAHIVVTDAPPRAKPLARELRAADCGKLVDAVSVAVALALGAADASAPVAATPSAAGANADATTSMLASAAVNAEPPPPGATDQGEEEIDSTSSAPALSISLWLLGDAGSLASPSVGTALGAELGWRKLELRALATLLFEQETRVQASSTPAPGAKLQLITGGLMACAAPFGSLRSPLSTFACIGAELGRLSGVGTRVASPRRGSALWAAPVVQVGAAWAVPDTALRLSIGLVAAAPLNRDEFALREIGTVHQPPNVIGRLTVGLGVGFD